MDDTNNATTPPADTPPPEVTTPPADVSTPPASEAPTEAPATTEPNSNSGTPATTMEGGTQPPQPSTAGQNFDKQVTDHLNEVAASEDPYNDIEGPNGSTLVAHIKFGDEAEKMIFESDKQNVELNTDKAGGASVALNITGREYHENNSFKATHGYLDLRMIDATHGHIYVFRDDSDAEKTVFIASYSPNP